MAFLNYYVYRHRRKDTDEVFYIGMGRGRRAVSSHSRNPYWQAVAKKGFYVEILQNNIEWEKACELEIFLISLYGRKILKTGLLVNMTDGGEGNKGYVPSEKTKKAHSERMKGVNNPNFGISQSKEFKKRMSETRIKNGSSRGGKNGKAKLVLNKETGIFYDCLKDAAQSINKNYSTVKAMVQNHRKNQTALTYC